MKRGANGEIAGRNSMDKEKNEMIVELKKTLNRIYDRFEQRMDRHCWKNAVKDAAEKAPDEALKTAAEFIMKHPHIPASCVRSAFLAADLRNRPAMLSELYSEAVVRGLIKRMTAEDPVRYHLIRPDLPEKELDEFIDAVRAAESHLKKGQAYLAGVKAAEAERIFPGHPDVSLLQAKIACLRYDYNGAERFLQSVFSSEQADARAYELAGDIYAARKNYPQARSAYMKALKLPSNSGEERLNRRIEAVSAGVPPEEVKSESSDSAVNSQIEEARRLERGGDTDKAERIYQSIIAKDYRQFEAYYPLGKIFLNQQRAEEADYLAEILLDFSRNAARAMLLKGLVLEFGGRREDALFYYNAAAAVEPENMAVFCHKKRLTALLDHNEKEAAQAVRALQNPEILNSGKDKSPHTGIFAGSSEKEREIRKIDENARELLNRGRMTEAYYDLMKKSADYPESAVLACRKAEILTLMGREAEARTILSALKEEERTEEKAADALCDLDYKIVGEKKEEDLEYDVLPEVYFNTGRYEACREAIGRIREEQMTPELFALKGRCQVMDGHFSDALRSFDRALKEKPSLRGVRLMKGMILQSKRDFKGALAMYDEALKEGEDLEAVSGIKAALLYEQERNAELLVFRSDAAKMKRRSYDVDGFVGLVYMQRTPHDDKNGMDYLETAMSAGSQNVEFYIAAVRSYLTDERCYAALSAAEAGLCAIPSSRELFALKAEVLYQLGKYDAAELNAGTLLSEDPEDARLHYLLGRIEEARGGEKESLRWLKSAAELDENNHTYIYAYADRCFETGDRRSAETYYTRALQLNPRDYISLKRRAILLEKRGEDEAAIADVRSSLKIHPNDAEAYVILGNIVAMYDIEDIGEETAQEEAAKKQSLTDVPESGAVAAIDMADAAGRSEESRKTDRKETECGPEESGGSREVSGLSGEEEARAEFTEEENRRTDADFSEAEAGGIGVQSSEREPAERKITSEEEGESSEEKAEVAKPAGEETAEEGEEFSEVRTDAESLFQEGEAPWSYAKRNSDDGEKGHEMLIGLIDDYSANPEFYFYKAVSIDPKYRESYISLAKYQAETGRYEKAMKNIEKAIHLNPDLTDGYMVRGIICHLKGDNDEAISNFREVTEREAENLRAYSYISKCCNAEGRYAEAIEAAEKGLQINGSYVNFFVNKGVALYHTGQYEEAVNALRRVIANQNTVHTAAVESAYRFRGMSYEKLGDTEKAIADYRKLLRFNPDRRDVKKRVSELEKQIDESKPKSRLSSIFRRRK